MGDNYGSLRKGEQMRQHETPWGVLSGWLLANLPLHWDYVEALHICPDQVASPQFESWEDVPQPTEGAL